MDFIRIDPAAPPPGRGIVVARVSFSPILAAQLVGALTENFNLYTKASIEQEVGPDDSKADDTDGEGA